MTYDLTPLDGMRERTKSDASHLLRTLNVEANPLAKHYAVMLDANRLNVLAMFENTNRAGTFTTPVISVENAEAIVAAARDAHNLVHLVDGIRAKFEHEAKQLQATSAQLSREAIRPGLSKADRKAACEESERYRNYSTWADSVVRTLDKTIAELLNPEG
ncbi:hypothetical protein HYP71_gp060 [Arthrobacter phage KBurrousTX]|uniref:Uncharacterized protein n=1 Tax=Arthrobacter phage KBurrousTX TaxID=2315608 RepID=A0A386KB48_9CAUD|nr:hypothetical protein HYP71_gp060 [Arthrobacter phage KBurrousTX]AYD81554.1 hypothetical protein KBurrousTX_60 [Arthrobacter phage KBurrousTX]